MFKISKIKLANRRIGLIVGLGLIISGLLVIGAIWFGTWRSQTSAVKPANQALESNAVKDDGTPLISGIPTRLQIPSVGIDLKVIPGYYNSSKQSWTLSLDSAQWGVMTAQPNNKQGDTFIYAHDRKGLFVTLPKVKPGDKATILTSNGHKLTYEFRQSVVTVPQDTSLFTYQGKPVLILQTCTGAWYQKRQLFTFDLVGAG